MQANTLSLTKEMLGDLHCEVGDEKVLSLPVRVTKYGPDGATFEVTDVATAEEAEPAEAPTAPEEDYSETAPAVNAMLARRAA